MNTSLDKTEVNTELENTELLASLGEDSHYSPAHKGSRGVSSSVEERALNLLGSGAGAEQVAMALGVSSGRISQLLSKKVFSDKVASLRYQSLQQSNKRDEKYGSLEDKLLGKLERSIPLLLKPESILKAIQVVNGAKRRGQSAPEHSTTSQNIVNLVLPTQIVQQFTTNINNQVVKAGDQELLTIPSGNLLKQVEDMQEAKGLEDLALSEDLGD